MADLPLEHETSLFIVVSTLDLLMTAILLRHPGFFESNPLAGWFLIRWGMRGMVFFKFGLVAFICLLTQAIATRKPNVARTILRTAIAAVALVVVYSLTLLVRGLL